MIRHAVNCLPEEACGLLAVDEPRRVRMVYPLTNSQHSATSFTIEPREHFGALRHAEQSGWNLGGVFHSHPQGTAELSSTDLDQPHDPDWFHVVVGFVPRLEIRGWSIVKGVPRPLGLARG